MLYIQITERLLSKVSSLFIYINKSLKCFKINNNKRIFIRFYLLYLDLIFSTTVNKRKLPV